MDVQQHRPAFGVEPLSSPQRSRYLRGFGDGDADRAEAFGDLGVVACHVGEAELLTGRWVAARVGSHAAVVQQDRRDRRSGADRSLDVQARHAEGAVAHEIDAELVGLCQLRPRS